MAAQIISFAARLREPATRDWSSQELAEFYRVESALLQAGLQLETDRGLSDEGDPWFVFCRVDTGEVFIHFARVDGWYVVDGAAMGAPARGRDFGALVRDLIGRHPLTDVRRPGSNIHLHPAAILIALVGAAFFHSGRAKAAEPDGHHAGDDAAAPRETRRGLWLNLGSNAPTASDGGRAVALDATEVAAVLTGVAIGLRELTASTPASAAPTADLALLPAASPFAAPAIRDASVRMERSASAVVLGGLAAADVRAALTVMAVFHDLARSVAAPQAAAPAVAAFVAVAATSVGDAAQGGAPPPPPPPGPPAPLLLVHLASGPLPQIEALALVSADGVLARVSPDRVVHVDQLPGLLSYLISHGEIVSVPPSSPDPGVVGDPAAAVAASDHGTGATVLVDPAHHVEAKPPADHAHDDTGVTVGASTPPAPIQQPVPTDPAPPVLTAPAPPHAATQSAYDARIDAAVQAFVSQVADVQVMITGHDVVFYDPRIMSVLNPDSVLDSVTWRLEDGSTVSLVGTVPELHAAHGVG